MEHARADITVKTSIGIGEPRERSAVLLMTTLHRQHLDVGFRFVDSEGRKFFVDEVPLTKGTAISEVWVIVKPVDLNARGICLPALGPVRNWLYAHED